MTRSESRANFDSGEEATRSDPPKNTGFALVPYRQPPAQSSGQTGDCDSSTEVPPRRRHTTAFRDTVHESRARFRLQFFFLVVSTLCAMLALHNTPWIAVMVGSCVVLAYLHHRTAGRTSPLAAMAFAVCGPFLGAAIGFIYLGREAIKTDPKPPDEVDVVVFIAQMFVVGIVGGALTAVVAAMETREEWVWLDDVSIQDRRLRPDQLWTRWKGRTSSTLVPPPAPQPLRTHAAPALFAVAGCLAIVVVGMSHLGIETTRKATDGGS